MERLLGGPPSTFIEKYLHKLPFSMPGRAEPFQRLATWETLDAILATSSVDLMAAREGRLFEGRPPASFAEAHALFNEGYTLVVRHAEKHEARLADLAREFQEDFGAPVNIHFYATPAAQHGFGWHYDAEDVFVLQAQGQKEYLLRKNSVNPWPLVETIPADMGFPRETMPVMKCSLAAGDWLYVPTGWWHQAQAVEESLSLAVGVLSLTVVDYLGHLRRHLLESLAWRQRLPILGNASARTPDETLSLLRSMVAELAKDMTRSMTDERVLRSFIEEKRWNPSPRSNDLRM